MSICLETEDDERAWQDYVSRAVGFLELYSYLADAYILDFFVDGSWSSLPDGWRHTLDAWPAERLADFIADDDTGTPGGRTWPSVAPLSLLCYRAGCRALSLRRRPLPSPRPVADFLRRCSGGRLPAGDPAAAAAEQWPADAAAELSAAGGQLAALHHVFRRHVKPKKQHELRRLARLVELTAPPLVVDLGSGRGHLSRYLAYGSRRPVVCLEANAAFVNGARKLDEQLEQSLQKKELPLPARPLHSACHITEDMDHRKFAEMLSSLTGAPTQSLRFTALGLHTCGDLAALLLRQFVRSPQCGAVVSVGCCYMKLSTAAGGWRGYPLSGHVAAAAAARRYHMSYEAREVACHAIEEYAARLRAGGEEHLKRSAGQFLLYIHTPRRDLMRSLPTDPCVPGRAGEDTGPLGSEPAAHWTAGCQQGPHAALSRVRASGAGPRDGGSGPAGPELGGRRPGPVAPRGGFLLPQAHAGARRRVGAPARPHAVPEGARSSEHPGTGFRPQTVAQKLRAHSPKALKEVTLSARLFFCEQLTVICSDSMSLRPSMCCHFVAH